MGSTSPSYKGHRYAVEVTSHCVWRYFRFPLSFGQGEELMFQRGVIVSYGTGRRCVQLGPAGRDPLQHRQHLPITAVCRSADGS
ncbi:hypothetical protein [Streptomyces sp. NPDC057909]|uniref:hypothetical protein n=1 Tax=Streptomyces sp. NPDC057909 TaxID=3346277 RepID=UPI0036E2B12A